MVIVMVFYGSDGHGHGHAVHGSDGDGDDVVDLVHL